MKRLLTTVALVGLLAGCGGQPNMPATIQADVVAVNTAIFGAATGLLAAANAACAEYAPVAAAAQAVPDPKVQTTLGYVSGLCSVATGQVIPGSSIDASTAAWVGAGAALVKVAVAAQASPTK